MSVPITTSDTLSPHAEQKGRRRQWGAVAQQSSLRRAYGTILVLLIALFLMLDSMRGDSATPDEFDHLISGYAYLRQLDLQGVLANAVGAFEEQPPLIKALAAVPLLFFHIELPDKQSIGHPPATYAYFYGSGNDPDRILFWSRLPMVLLFILLALLTAKWARELYGPAAGLFALCLAAFNTTLMAHGRYAMTDLGLAFFYTLSLYTFLRCLRDPSVRNMVTAGIVFGLAQVAKFSAVLLVPTFVVLAACHFFRGVGEEAHSCREKRMQHAFHLLTVLLIVWFAGAIVIVGVYSVQTWNMTTEGQTALIQELLGHLEHGRPARLVAGIAAVFKPLGQYALGLAMVMHHNNRGHLAFLWGHVSKTGWWTYFPLAFLLKTQLPLIGLLCLTPFVKKEGRTFEGWMLVVATAVFAIASVSSHLNIGIRHLLPIYPPLIVWASQTIRWPMQKGTINRAKTVIVASLAVWYVFGALEVHPHYVAYFNELIGGPKRGYQYLSDSNVDMAQDIKRLGLYLQEVDIKDIHILCFGETNNLWGCKGVTYYIPQGKPWGAEFPIALPEELPSGFFAIGKTPRWLARELLKRNPKALQQWGKVEERLEKTEPVHTVGHSIDIYYLSPE